MQARNQQMNQFTKLYKTFSDSELLKITRSPDDYQPDAVDAARKEIDARQLTDEELKTAETELEKEEQEKRQKKEKRKAVENKIKGFANSLNPINEEKPTTERQILLLTVVFGFKSVYRLYSGLDLIDYMFFSQASEWNGLTFFYVLLVFLLPVSIVLYWLRKPIGWIGLTAFLSYSTLESIGAIIGYVLYEPSGIPALDRISPTFQPVTQIAALALFAGSIWLLTKPDMRMAYSINTMTAITTIVLSVVIPGLLTLTLFL